MKVRWTPGAQADLRAIVQEIARDRPQTAARIGLKIRSSTGDLRDQPLMGKVVEEFGNHAIRERIVRPWRVIYRVLPGEVHILAVVHARRTLNARSARTPEEA